MPHDSNKTASDKSGGTQVHMTIRVVPSECWLCSYWLTVFMNLRVTGLQQTRPWVAAQGRVQLPRFKRGNHSGVNHTSVLTRTSNCASPFHSATKLSASLSAGYTGVGVA